MESVEHTENVSQQEATRVQTAVSAPTPAVYLDPEGGYADKEAGQAAEIAAMTRQAPLSVNNLPTKYYLEKTITPTVLKALSECAKARPDKPLEFMAYYLLKHNPDRQQAGEGAPIGHKHPDDKEE